MEIMVDSNVILDIVTVPLFPIFLSAPTRGLQDAFIDQGFNPQTDLFPQAEVNCAGLLNNPL